MRKLVISMAAAVCLAGLLAPSARAQDETAKTTQQDKNVSRDTKDADKATTQPSGETDKVSREDSARFKAKNLPGQEVK